MHIVCCIKAVPTEVTGLAVSSAGDRLEYRSRSVTTNETDEYALEEALFLRKRLGGRVTVITAGPRDCEEVLYKALAKGADKAVRVELDTSVPALAAVGLASAIQGLTYDLILTGVESKDNMAAYVGVSLAQRLRLPFALGVAKVEAGAQANAVQVTKELGGGTQVELELALPAVLCIQSGIQPLSYPPVAKVFQVRRQRLDCLKLADLNVGKSDLEMAHWFKPMDVSPPKVASAVQMLSGDGRELARATLGKIQEAL